MQMQMAVEALKQIGVPTAAIEDAIQSEEKMGALISSLPREKQLQFLMAMAQASGQAGAAGPVGSGSAPVVVNLDGAPLPPHPAIEEDNDDDVMGGGAPVPGAPADAATDGADGLAEGEEEGE